MSQELNHEDDVPLMQEEDLPQDPGSTSPMRMDLQQDRVAPEPADDQGSQNADTQESSEAEAPMEPQAAEAPSPDAAPAPAEPAQPQEAPAKPAAHFRESLMSLPSLDAQPSDEPDPLEPETHMADPEAVLDEPQETFSVPVPSDTLGEGEGFQTAGPSMEQLPARSGGGAKRVLLVLGIIVGAVAIIYLIGALYFSSHFLPNTRVNGEEVSGMSVENLAAHVTEIGTSYKTHVSGDGIDVTIPGSDIGVSYDGEAYGAQAKAQIRNWRWPLELNRQHDYQVDQGITFNKELLASLVGSHVDAVNSNATPPTNATMSYDAGTKAFVVVPDALGTQIDREATIDYVSQGIITLQEDVILGDDQLVQPVVHKDDEILAQAIDKSNDMLSKNVVLRIAGKDAETISADLMQKWLSLDAACNIVVDREAVKTWAQGDLSRKFDTVGSARTYTRPDGKQIQIEGGTYGWSVDGAALSDVIADNLQALNTNPIDVPMNFEAATWNPGGQDWPTRYIDVDLDEQYVRMYDESSNLIWESECVSGNTSAGHGTVTGVFYLMSKESPSWLIGPDYDHDGKEDYRTFVNYWMPFEGGGFGLHDATWRGAFGGSIYTYDGSHGCVNLPFDRAQELYEIVNVGDVVVTHY